MESRGLSPVHGELIRREIVPGQISLGLEISRQMRVTMDQVLPIATQKALFIWSCLWKDRDTEIIPQIRKRELLRYQAASGV
jgi:hypothetical protein